MEYRILGKTSLRVSALSYGASSLGSVFREIDKSEGIRTVHEALDLGVNLIDCSPYYGLTKAETVLGKALKGINRDRYYLSTKAGRYGEDEFDFSAKRLISSVDESLQRLGVDYLDIIHLHDIEFGNLSQIVDESIPTLSRLKEQGKIRFYGVSGLPIAIYEKIISQVEIDTIITYCHYSLNDTSLLSILPYLASKDVGVINASPLSMGLLSTRPVPDWHPASDKIRQTCHQAAQFCEQQGVSIAKLAVQYSVANSDVPTTLVGTANPVNLRNNVQWIEEALDQELLAQVLAILEPIHNHTWLSGRPENN